MSMVNYKEIIWNGLWKNNAGIVALLGLCPLLAVSTSVVNGIGLGVATVLVMAFSNGIVSMLRNWIPREIRTPVYILIIAVLVTIIDLSMNAFVQPLYLVLGAPISGSAPSSAPGAAASCSRWTRGNAR